jgi:hypothetical protein
VTRRREILIVWILLSAPVMTWVVLMDIALVSHRVRMDTPTHVALAGSLIAILFLSVGIVETAHEHWRTICRYMAATFAVEALLLFGARGISGSPALVSSIVALLAAIMIFLGSAKH